MRAKHHRICRWTLIGTVYFVSMMTTVHGQVNIEELRQDDTSTGISGSLAFELESHTGNTDIQEIGIEGRLVYTKPSVTTLLLTRSDFGWEQGQRFANEGLVHLRQNYRLRDRVDVEVFGQYNYDTTYFLDFRALAGTGIRINLLDTKIIKLWEGTSYLLEHERLSGLPPQARHPTRMTVSRWNNYLSSRLTIDNRLSSAWTVYIQPRFNAMQDFRVLSDINLEINLGGPLVLVMSFAMRYDNDPPFGVRRYDTSLENSLAVTF